MADIKTHLRELSPLLAIAGITEVNQQFTPKNFITILKDNFETLDNLPLNIIKATSFTALELNVIKRGIKLGVFLLNKFGFNRHSHVTWHGNSTHSEMPIDLIIDSKKFSLKEESFILENMGLYRLINLVTGFDTSRGKHHIFLDYSKQEYDDWFNYSWNYLVDSRRKWRYQSERYNSEIYFTEASVVFKYIDSKVRLPLIRNLGINEFEERTTNHIREKVFAKWLKETLESHPVYIKYKKICAETAGKNLVSFLSVNKNENNQSLYRLLRVYDNEYFYAKTTDSKIEVFAIPHKEEFKKFITIEDINYSVPKSQLNIITKIVNKATQKGLILRNEIRFSHGQFNGTPEAKMYYDRGSDLSTIYNPIL